MGDAVRLIQWIFLGALAVLVVMVATRHVPESRDPSAAPHLDWLGTVLVVTGLGLVTYALTSAADAGIGVWATTLVPAGPLLFLVGGLTYGAVAAP